MNKKLVKSFWNPIKGVWTLIFDDGTYMEFESEKEAEEWLKEQK